ncbi:DUF3526 domain-containing protein [uncultured Microscilla sp.]|uniref:DUF3526 domain-containing protein n=1 Tax=uncultured Microscilla sp. TaxID=432653 RepID=UPI00261C3FD2|nr:DUF3526 domain-containing protein [uncultured Microscilla sp.]
MNQLLIISFFKTKASWIGLASIFFAGMLSLYFGGLFIEETQENERRAILLQKENIERNVQHHPKDIGLLLYYQKFGLVNQVSPLASLAIGQRDISPSIQRVNIRNLEEQKYNSRLANPVYQLIGNFDFSFVLVYFIPLVIIALCFNMISEEKEGGTWALALSQTNNTKGMIRAKLLLRYSSILVVLVLLLIIAKFYLSIPLNQKYAAFCLVSVAYVSFWFAVVWWVISFHLSSSKNALVLLTIWVFLNVIVPAAISGIVSLVYPIPETFGTVVKSREGYHNKWDKEKAPTIQKFIKHYPQLAQYKHPKGARFSWFWYFAMQQMGDDEASAQSRELQQKVKKRIRLSENTAMFFPSAHTQLVLNSLANAGLQNQLNFMQALEKFHERKRLYFYPKIFSQTASTTEKWDKHTLAKYEEQSEVNWLQLLWPLLLGIGICLGAARLNQRKFYHL